jgi:poly(3-hydroxybutyrate) depolymerase
MFSPALHHKSGRAIRCPARLLSGSIALLATLASVSVAGFAQGVPLPAVGANLEATSVSGLSSGAFMASQFHIAHSGTVIGAGIVAGGPYGCAEAATPSWASGLGLNATVFWATGRCMAGSRLGLGIPATSTLQAKVQALAQARRIDPLSEIARGRVYLFTSTADEVVKSPVVDAAAALYAGLGVSSTNRESIRHDKARHALVTEEKGAACGQQDRTFITDCDYDQAGAILRHIYPDVRTRNARPSAALMIFSQEPFTRGLAAHGLADNGYAYLPPDCRDASGCRVHVVFHGCSQAGEGFARDGGYAEWADGNRLIVLFPQVKASDGVNPLGCWDWWGYTGSDYLTQAGPQIAAVKRMLDRLTKAPGSN